MLSLRKLEYYRKYKISEPLLFLAGVCDQAPSGCTKACPRSYHHLNQCSGPV